MAVRSTDDVS
jgi:hypothetical protein